MVLAREDWRSSNELGKDTPDCPHVNFFIIVLLAQNDFWCAVPPCDDVFSEGVCKLGITIGELFDAASQPEIANFQVTVRVDEQVAWFYISVHNVCRVKKHKSAEQLVHEVLVMLIRECLL